MNWHIFKRARVQAGVAFGVLSAPLAVAAMAAFAQDSTVSAAAEDIVREAPETSMVKLYGVLATYALMLGGALTYAVIRWLNKVGKNVPRDPSRTQEQIAAIGSQVKDQFDSVDDRIDSLQSLIAATDRRTSRLEGYVRAFANSPVVLDDDTERGDG